MEILQDNVQCTVSGIRTSRVELTCDLIGWKLLINHIFNTDLRASATAGGRLPQAASLQRLHALLPAGDSRSAHSAQRGPALCQPRPLPYQTHLCLLLHTSREAQVLLRLDDG